MPELQVLPLMEYTAGLQHHPQTSTQNVLQPTQWELWPANSVQEFFLAMFSIFG